MGLAKEIKLALHIHQADEAVRLFVPFAEQFLEHVYPVDVPANASVQATLTSIAALPVHLEERELKVGKLTISEYGHFEYRGADVGFVGFRVKAMGLKTPDGGEIRVDITLRPDRSDAKVSFQQGQHVWGHIRYQRDRGLFEKWTQTGYYDGIRVT